MKKQALKITKKQHLNPDLWVDVLEIDPCFTNEINYYASCQVKDLDKLLATVELPPDYYLLAINND